MTVYLVNNDELYHHGILGQKWGVRRYQNEDGSLTAEGKARLDYKTAKKDYKSARKEYRKASRSAVGPNKLMKNKEARKNFRRKETELINKKVEYKVSGKKDDKKEIAREKLYAREIKKSGLPGSTLDDYYGERSSRIYDNLVSKRGKEYADKVVNRSYSAIKKQMAAGAAAFVTGTIILPMAEKKLLGL